jgi:ubiquitin carboxyl-terminal hydrolase 8
MAACLIDGGREIEGSNFHRTQQKAAMADQAPPSQDGGAATGLGGLVNMGFTCYANAALQCIRQTKKMAWLCEPGRLATLFEAQPKTDRRRLQQDLTTTFAEVVQLLGRCQRGQSVRPGEFWRRVAPTVQDTLYEHLASREPHDSHEFYLFLLETLHEATATEVEIKVLRPPPVTPEDRLVIGALEAWKKEFTKEYSPFVDIFYGLGHWQTACQRCGNITHRWESFNSLKASVPARADGGAPQIAALLAADLEPETIEQYDCDTCKEKTTVRRWFRVWRLPQTVVLVLKRFQHNGQKITTPVAALEGGGEAMFDFAPFFSEVSPERHGTTRYTLRSIVDHHGSSLGGHYTAQVRDRDSGLDAADSWYFYDDEGVANMKGRGPIFGESTYILFLERE